MSEIRLSDAAHPELTPASPASDQAVDEAAALGSRAAWARDFAILGALSTGLGLVALGLGGVFLMLPIAIGAATGAGVGWFARPLVARHRRALPGAVLALLGPILGGFWGGLVGGLSMLIMFPAAEAISIGASIGALCGLAQLSWFWVVYLAVRMRQGPVWLPLVLAALTPFLGNGLLRLLSGHETWPVLR
ncbi:MAG: hypothetical protein U1F43_10910 [Myxococcota bacterium]